MSKLNSMTISKLVQGFQRDVKAAIISGVNSQDMDTATSILQFITGSALRRVPSNALGATNVGKVGDLTLGLPMVFGDEAIGTVRARHIFQGTRRVIISSVEGNYIYS